MGFINIISGIAINLKLRLNSIGLFIITLFALAHCGNRNEENPYYYNSPETQSTVTFRSLQNSVFNSSCIQCHTQMASYSGVRNYITPGNPEASSIYQAVKSGQMPRNNYRLSNSQINSISKWIQSGAPNN
ncbi:MAG: hypothetical protein EXR74_03435 [Bdellovibrionales bacterium]|nr:hypothetical protein [Bdellovibrionales bacterium]